MITKACMLVLGGVGAIVGAVLLTTEKGKELNENLTDAFDLFDNKVSKYFLKMSNTQELIKGGE